MMVLNGTRCVLWYFFPKGNINLTLVFQLKRILIAVHNKQKIQTTIILKLLAALLYFYQGIFCAFSTLELSEFSLIWHFPKHTSYLVHSTSCITPSCSMHNASVNGILVLERLWLLEPLHGCWSPAVRLSKTLHFANLQPKFNQWMHRNTSCSSSSKGHWSTVMGLIPLPPYVCQY